MGGGAWWATVCGVAKSRTRLSNFTFALINYFNPFKNNYNKSFASGKEPAHEGDMRDASPILGREDALEKEMTPSPVFSSGESHRGESHKGGWQAIVHGVEKAGHHTHTHTHTHTPNPTHIHRNNIFMKMVYFPKNNQGEE